MRHLFLTLCLCILSLADIAAQEIVSGTIVDNKNEPLPGARIEIVGRSETAYSDIDGTFRIEVPEKIKKIRVIYVGYKPIERKYKPGMIVKLGNGWAGNPSGFRGFFELNGGFGFGGNVNIHAGNMSVEDLRTFLNAGILFSFGYQINRNFYTGLGLGFMAQMAKYKERVYNPSSNSNYSNYVQTYSDYLYESLPLFLDLRYDLDIAAKTTPYIGLKIGYQFLFGGCEGEDYFMSVYDSNNELELYTDDVGAFLFQPSIGFRTSLGKKAGINFGLSYNIKKKKKLYGIYHYNQLGQDGSIINNDERMDFGKSYSGVLMFNISFDY